MSNVRDLGFSSFRENKNADPDEINTLNDFNN